MNNDKATKKGRFARPRALEGMTGIDNLTAPAATDYNTADPSTIQTVTPNPGTPAPNAAQPATAGLVEKEHGISVKIPESLWRYYYLCNTYGRGSLKANVIAALQEYAKNHPLENV